MVALLKRPNLTATGKHVMLQCPKTSSGKTFAQYFVIKLILLFCRDNIVMNPNKACFFAYTLTVLLILCVFCLSTPLIATNYLSVILRDIGIATEKTKPPTSKWGWIHWHMIESFSLIVAILLDKYVPVVSIYIQVKSHLFAPVKLLLITSCT